MNQVWVLVLCVVGLLAFWLGLVVYGFRTKRENSQRFKIIFDNFIQGNGIQDTLDVSMPLARDQIALRDLYLKCQHGLHDRAYTVALQLNRTQTSPEVSALLLRLGLFLNRYDHLDSLLNRAELLEGLERITFANLVCSGRWKEAVSFYKRNIFGRHGSKVEWRMLQLCASAFADLPVEKTDLSTYEIDMLSRLSTMRTMQEEYSKSVSDYLAAGVCYLDELKFLVNRKVFHLDYESNADASHPTKEPQIRGDWIGAEYAEFCREFGIEAPQTDSSKAHLLRIRKWLQSQRGYRCSYCGEVRRGFGVVCNHCLRLEFGEPMRVAIGTSVPQALVVHGVDSARVEQIYWMALLDAT